MTPDPTKPPKMLHAENKRPLSRAKHIGMAGKPCGAVVANLPSVTERCTTSGIRAEQVEADRTYRGRALSGRMYALALR